MVFPKLVFERINQGLVQRDIVFLGKFIERENMTLRRKISGGNKKCYC